MHSTYATHIYELSYQALILIMVLSGPPVLISMTFGLAVAIFQAATQIQEQTLSFVIKLVAVILSLIYLGPWLSREILTYASNIFHRFPEWQ